MFNRWIFVEFLRIKNLSRQIKDNFFREADERFQAIEAQKVGKREKLLRKRPLRKLKLIKQLQKLL